MTIVKFIILFFSLIGLAKSELSTSESFFNALSQGSYYLSGNRCEELDAKELAATIEQNRLKCKAVDVAPNINVLDTIAKDFEQFSEDQFVLALAGQQVKELGCAKDFANSLASNSQDEEITRIADNFEKYRRARQLLSLSTQRLAGDTTIFPKHCPMTLGELKRDYPPGPATNPSFVQLCDQIIRMRVVSEMIKSSIPLSNIKSPVSDLLDKYSVAEAGAQHLDMSMVLKKSIKTAYGQVGQSLANEQSNLKKKIKEEGIEAFGRQERRVLMSDPRAVEHVAASGIDPERLKSLACRMDGRYGKGADQLELQLGLGSLFIGGSIGAAGKLGKVAIGLSNGLKVARASGRLSANSARLLKMGALSGVLAADGLVATSEILSNCFNNLGASTRVRGTKGGKCVSAPTIEEGKTNQCVLLSFMHGLGVASGAYGLYALRHIPSGNPNKSTDEGWSDEFASNAARSDEPARASQFADLDQQDKLIEELRGLMKRHKDSTDPMALGHIRAKSKELAKLSQKTLKEEGIETVIKLEVDEKPNYYYLEVVSGDKEFPIGRLFEGASDKLAITHRFDPFLGASGPAGQYLPSENRITFGMEQINRIVVQPDSFMLIHRHEVNHAYHIRQLKAGKPGPYYASLRGGTDPKLDSYQDFLSYEELSTYYKDARVAYGHVVKRGGRDPVMIRELQRSANFARVTADNIIKANEEALEIATMPGGKNYMVFSQSNINRSKAMVEIELLETGEKLKVHLVKSTGPDDPKNTEYLIEYLQEMTTNAQRKYIEASNMLDEFNN